MPLPASVVGASIEPVVHEVDARWIMAHATSIGALNSCYLDTTRPTGVVAHPLFTACVEWPAMLAARRLVPDDVLPRHEEARGVHASHDLTIHRLVRPGDILTTAATVQSIEARAPGAYEVIRFVTTDQHNAPVATTEIGSLFVGVDVVGQPENKTVGDDRSNGEATAPAKPKAPPRLLGQVVDIPANAAHVYTEGSRIYNPIHTDAAFAEFAGLPHIILHGTATLAIAMSEIIDVFGHGDPTRLRRVRCRFAGMVPMPSTITVCVDRRSDAVGEREYSFEVHHADGRPVLSHGSATLTRSGR